MVSYADSQVDMYKSLEDLRRMLVVPVSGSERHPWFQQRIGGPDNRMFETAGYDSRKKVEAAREKVNAFWAGMTEFLTDESRILEGDFVYGFRR
jgi:hypothetical protein